MASRVLSRPVDLAGIFLLALLPGVLTAWLIPLGAASSVQSCAPDELAHMAYVAKLADGDLRAWPQSPDRMSMHPPSHYVAQVAGVLAARAGLDREWMYRLPPEDPAVRGYPLARLGSAALGALGVVLLAIAAAVASESSAIGRIVGWVAALYPQRFFVSGYVTSDVSAFAAGALLMVAVALWVRAGRSSRYARLVGVAIGMTLLAKVTVWGLVPPTALWMMIAWRRGTLSLRALCEAGLVAAAVFGPGWLIQAWRTGGDPIGVVAYRQYVEQVWHAGKPQEIPLGSALLIVRHLLGSAFMRFSNLTVGLPSLVGRPWFLLLACGTPLAVWGLRRASPDARGLAYWWLASGSLAAASVFLHSMTIDFSPQGRYVLLFAVTLTAVAVAAPVASGRSWARAWVAAWLAWMGVAAVYSLGLLWTTPCGPGIVLPAS